MTADVWGDPVTQLKLEVLPTAPTPQKRGKQQCRDLQSCLGLVSSVCSDPEQGRAVTGQMGNVPWGRTQLGASLPTAWGWN